MIALLLSLVLQFPVHAEEPFELWMQTSSARFREVLRSSSVNISQLCRDLGIGRTTIYRLERGALPMSVEFGQALGEYLRVSPEWILALDVVREHVTEQTLRDLKGPGAQIGRRLVAEASKHARSCERALSDEAMAEHLRVRGWTVIAPKPAVE